jgi:hypothetical protein
MPLLQRTMVNGDKRRRAPVPLERYEPVIEERCLRQFAEAPLSLVVAPVASVFTLWGIPDRLAAVFVLAWRIRTVVVSLCVGSGSVSIFG